MGLKKTKTLKSGHEAEYHRIVQLNMNYDRLDAVTTLAIYKTQADRDADATPIDSYQIDLGLEFHDGTYEDGDDVMKNVSLKEAYKALDKLSKLEAAKPEEDQDQDLSFYSDAVSV